MRINLSEIPEEGKNFHWTNQTAELNSILTDLIGSQAYKTEFFIRPINSRDYEMTGTITTQAPEQCSRCGIDFNFKVNQKFHEILIPHQPDDRVGKYAKVNHISDSNEGGPSALEYDSNLNFNAGEYIHEQIAIAIPFNPAPPETDKGDCSTCGLHVQGKSFGYNEEMPVEKPNNPFSALKGLKLQ